MYEPEVSARCDESSDHSGSDDLAARLNNTTILKYKVVLLTLLQGVLAAIVKQCQLQLNALLQ